MNIPENILQQVADEAFLSSNGGMMGLLTCNKKKNHVFWHEERYARLAVIQHALNNPALAPFLSALPRRESQALAEATPPFPCAINHTEQNVQFRDAAGYCMICGTDWPDPAAEVPLGPEDVPPGSVLKALSWEEYEWRSVWHVYSEGVLLDNCPTTHSWIELEANWQINTSIPDTGRWDKNAWRPCSKPAGKEVAK